MPELAEVEYYRRCWDCGLGQRIVGVKAHEGIRIFRDVPVRRLRRLLGASMLRSSEARGKIILFRFSDELWLGIHLGMTGKLRVENPGFAPAKHDHLVLQQKRRTLVFSDPRQFGRVLFHEGGTEPKWWGSLPLAISSKSFTAATMAEFLQRHRRLPIKAALLIQQGFPGVGNWMADEILWRAGLDPHTRSGMIRGVTVRTLWNKVRFVGRGAMKHVSKDFSDPPEGWLYHERWKRGGQCPIHQTKLRRETIGGRTTAWCPKCQG